MENSDDGADVRGNNNNTRRTPPPSAAAAAASSSYKLIRHQSSFHKMMGGGKAADVIMWRRRRASIGIIVVATVIWLLFEHSGLPFLTVCSDIFLALIVLLFLQANYAAYRNKQLQTLPQLVLSEEMVNNAAASFRVKFNYLLLMAHDIALGKDFKLVFKVVSFLWLLSSVGSMVSIFTLAYIGTIICITLPALYSRFEVQIDRYAGKLHRQFSRHYRIVDESISRLPRNVAKNKDH